MTQPVSHSLETAHPALTVMIDAALAAGARAAAIYETDFDASQKGDGSAVTEADKAGEAIILAALEKAFPDIPVLAEEAASEGDIPELGARFFLVDPLDGTREFVNKTGEFTVNIALIEDGVPVCGVVYAPGCSKLFVGCAGGGAGLQHVDPGADRTAAAPLKPIRARTAPPSGPVAVASRSHRSAETEDYLKEIGAAEFTPAGSSLKFCLIAEGLADVYPRLGRTMEWDTGAAQAVLEAAGGSVHILENGAEGAPLRYNKKARGFDNPHFVAWGAR